MAQPELNEVSSDDGLSYKATTTCLEHPAHFDEALKDAERLVKYAAEIGIDIDAETRDHVLQARASTGVGWSKETAANLLKALTKLAVSLRPVTAESLKACAVGTWSTVREYWIVAVCLATIIVPFSLFSFVSSAISNAIRTDIVTANELAVKLRAQLGPPAAHTRSSAPPTENSARPETQAPVGLSDADVVRFVRECGAVENGQGSSFPNSHSIDESGRVNTAAFSPELRLTVRQPLTRPLCWFNLRIPRWLGVAQIHCHRRSARLG